MFGLVLLISGLFWVPLGIAIAHLIALRKKEIKPIKHDDIYYTVKEDYRNIQVTNSKRSEIGMVNDLNSNWWIIGTSYENKISGDVDDDIFDTTLFHHVKGLHRIYAPNVKKAVKLFHEWLVDQEVQQFLKDELLDQYLN